MIFIHPSAVTAKCEAYPKLKEPSHNMQIDDLDEIDCSLNHMIQYVRSFGVHGAQLEQLFAEKLQIAFAAIDQFEDALADIPRAQPIH